MTYADWIRNMSDEDLAAFIVGMTSEAQRIMVEQLRHRLIEQGIDVELTLVDFAQASYMRHLRALQEERDDLTT